MKKQIIEIAEYDGWKKDGIWFYKKGRWTLVKDYATNLNELHRVALDVCDEQLINVNLELYYKIIDALKERPIRGRYTHLIKAVADGIEYLNTKKV